MNDRPPKAPPPPGLDQDHIARLVDRFYDRVRADALIGPVFNAIVTDWDAHKELLTRFWCSTTLQAHSYRGNPMGKHKPLPIGREHFDRWLALWHASVADYMPPEAGAVMSEYAERIGRGMKMGLGLADRPRARELGVPMYTAVASTRDVASGRG